MREETLEICTKIGCSVSCLKYCPQEIITTQYSGKRLLSLESFKALIASVPSNVTIIFSGVAEPFLNQDCISMIEYAHEKGHAIRIFSTLVGLKPEDANRLIRIPIEAFTLHLPDAEGNAKISLTQDYYESLGIILTGIHNISFMNMGNNFTSLKHEDFFRGNPRKPKKYFPVCHRQYDPNFLVHPNGDTYFCCQTRGLTERIGNLFQQTYPEIVKTFPSYSKKMRSDPNSICRYCGQSVPWWYYTLSEVKRKYYGNKLFRDILSDSFT